MALSDTAQSISNLTQTVKSFFESVGEIIGTIIEIVKAIWYGFTSLVSGVYQLFEKALSQDAVIGIATAFGKISDYIGGPATVFMASLFIIIIFRIFYGFVMGLIKGNDKYHTRKSNWSKYNSSGWEPTDYVDDITYPRLP